MIAPTFGGAPLTLDTSQTEGRVDACRVLVAFVVLLVGLPSTLIIPQLGGSTTPALLAGLLFLLWWAAARQVPGLGLAPERQPMRVLIGLFAASILASYAAGAMGDLSGLQTRAVDRGLLFTFALCGITLLAADSLRTRKQLDTVLTALVVMGTFSAFLGALSFFFDWYPIQHLRIPGLQVRGDIAFRGVRSDLPRVAGTAAHPIEFGVMMAMILPLALREAFRRSGRQRNVAWAAVALIGLGVAVSLSRSAMLGTVCALVILLASWPPRRRLWFLAALPLYVIALKLVKPQMLGTLLHLFTRATTDDSLVHRTNNYRRIGALMAHHWAVGSGFGSYVPTRATEILDNAYFGQLVETGIIGLLALLVLLGGGFVMANAVRRRAALADDRDRGAALTASMAVVLPSMFTFDAFGYSMASATVWLILGCCAAGVADQPQRISRRGRHRSMLKEALRKVANVDDRSSLSTRVRTRRFDLFRSLLDTVPRPVELIDVGGTETFWDSMGAADLPGVSIVVVNLTAPPTEHAAITTVVGDATDLHPVTDGQFDVAFSNSVIEHVGAFSAQRDMADELLRVAPRLFLQTPNRWFPIEPHFLFPGFALLPIRARAWMIRHFALGWRPRVSDPEEALALARSVRLMTRRELRILFPKATIERERFFGLTKSFLVHQGWDR